MNKYIKIKIPLEVDIYKDELGAIYTGKIPETFDIIVNKKIAPLFKNIRLKSDNLSLKCLDNVKFSILTTLFNVYSTINSHRKIKPFIYKYNRWFLINEERKGNNINYRDEEEWTWLK